MNYLETGLPHQDLYRKKSEFVPPRYKPLCSLGRRYLGLEPLSKSEMNSFINRLCQPKKTPEPDDPSKLTQRVRPVVSGTGRFNGRKRMTGNQIDRMVDRLTKRKTEPKSDVNESAKDRKHLTDNEHESVDIEDEREDEVDGMMSFRDMPSASPRRSIVREHTDVSPRRSSAREHTEGSLQHKNVHFERKESSVSHANVNQWLDSVQTQDRNDLVTNNTTSVNHDATSTVHPISGRTTSASDKRQKRNKEEDDEGEGERYESLYYRGVKTEIARKAFLQHKRSSMQMGRASKMEGGVKSAKTSKHVTTNQHSKLDDMQNRRPRVKTS